MAEPRKIIMPVDEEAAVRQMEVEAFRQIADGMKALNTDMRDVRERLIRIESNQLDRQVKEHADRLTKLETGSARQAGAMDIVTAILKSPTIAWLGMCGGLIWAVLTGKIHL